ncbi:MAG TPA: hypothetical protein VGV59_03425 [Pyrinomonadaceae bacterium]|nr:hypothetical protein [Pyrinomonadaceae bacterium]
MSQSHYCTRCGTQNHVGASYCASCGGPLIPPQTSDAYYEQQKKKQNSLFIAALIAIGAVFVITIVWLIAGDDARSSRPATLNANSAKSSPTPNNNLSPAERVAAAKKMLQADKLGVNEFIIVQGQLLSIPKDAPEYKEAQVLSKSLDEKKLKQDAEQQRAEAKAAQERAPALREELKENYRRTVAEAMPHLNFIGGKLTRTKGGYALWATHEFFSQYTFSAGDEARLVSDWMDRHRADLKASGIVRVGVMGEGPYASYVSFEVK